MSLLTLSFKGRPLATYPLHEGETCIGRDPGCTISIDSLAIQPRHARIVLENNEASVHDLDTLEGTFVNDVRIGETTPLKNGDIIRIGKHNLKLALSPPADTPTQPDTRLQDGPAQDDANTGSEPFPQTDTRRGFLQILNGPNMGKILRLENALMHVGKPGLQLAMLARRSEGIFITHLEGKMPTSINDQELGDATRLLHDGDIVKIGVIRMLFTLQ